MKVRACLMTMAVAGMASWSFGQIKGKVVLDGAPPEVKQIDMSGTPDCAKQHPDPVNEETYVVGKDGQLGNVVVSIKAEEGKELKGDVPKDAAKLDQKGCTYHPHVLAMMVGQDLIVANSDPFGHNVNALAEKNTPFNKSQPNVDNKPGMKVDPPKAEERFKVKCEIHPWMNAWINVFPHPYFAVSKPDGTFEIPTKGLANGKYTLQYWHEASGEPQEQEIEVTDGKAEAAEMKMPAANAAAPSETNVKLVSNTGASCCDKKDGAAQTAHKSEPAKGDVKEAQAKAG